MNSLALFPQVLCLSVLPKGRVQLSLKLLGVGGVEGQNYEGNN